MRRKTSLIEPERVAGESKKTGELQELSTIRVRLCSSKFKFITPNSGTNYVSGYASRKAAGRLAAKQKLARHLHHSRLSVLIDMFRRL